MKTPGTISFPVVIDALIEVGKDFGLFANGADEAQP